MYDVLVLPDLELSCQKRLKNLSKLQKISYDIFQISSNYLPFLKKDIALRCLFSISTYMLNSLSKTEALLYKFLKKLRNEVDNT